MYIFNNSKNIKSEIWIKHWIDLSVFFFFFNLPYYINIKRTTYILTTILTNLSFIIKIYYFSWNQKAESMTTFMSVFLVY